MMASNAGWIKERDAKNKQKHLAASREQNEHSEWMQQRDIMTKRKEEAELKAKQEEENKPEFLKNLASMKEKAQNKPQKKADEGPTLAELDAVDPEVPPWHRPGAPEKPEWVVLLLEAAKKEAGEDEDEEHVYVAPSPVQVPKAKQTLPSKETETEKPEWMKQASALKKASPTLKPQMPKGSEEDSMQKPWMKHILKHSVSPQQEKSIKDRPSWMMESASSQQRNLEKMSASLSSIGYLPERSKSADETLGNKPDWMKSASLLKKKDSMGDSISSISSLNLPDRSKSKSANNSFSGTEKPEWVKNAALLKKKSNESTKTKEKESQQDARKEEGEKPWMMRDKLKPRVSPEDLTTNIVQDKLKKKQPLKKPSLEISKDQLETNKVRAKLASRPSIVDKKAPVKKEEMEWMKKKLKPRGESTAASASVSSGQSPSIAPSNPIANKEKPDWMQRASSLQQKAKDAQQSTIAADAAKDEKVEEKPWLMRGKHKPRVTPDDLKSSKVQEKLENKPQLKKPAVPVTSDELLHSKVSEKLANRPDMPQRKSEFKVEEMEWIKKKLKPRNVPAAGNKGRDSSEEDKDTRPDWMKELKKKNSKSDSNQKDGSSTADETSEAQAVDAKDTRPNWMKEVQKNSSKSDNQNATENTAATNEDYDNKKPAVITGAQKDDTKAKTVPESTPASSTPEKAAQSTKDSELEPDEPDEDEKNQDILGILQGIGGSKAPALSFGSDNLLENERFWSSLADFGGSGNKHDSGPDDSDDDSEADIDMSFRQIKSVLEKPTNSSSSKDAKKKKSRSRSSSLDRKSKKKKDKKKEKKKKDKDKESEDKKKKKKDRKEKSDPKPS